MKPEEIQESLRKHMDSTHRKMSKKNYLSLRHIDIYTNSFSRLLSGEMNEDEFKKEFVGQYREINEEEIENMERSKTIAPIISYRFNESNVPIIEEEQVQIVD